MQQELTGVPSTRTVQAPQTWTSHERLAPVNPRWSRRKSSRTVRGSTSVSTARPLTVSRRAIVGRSDVAAAEDWVSIWARRRRTRDWKSRAHRDKPAEAGWLPRRNSLLRSSDTGSLGGACGSYERLDRSFRHSRHSGEPAGFS